jgi:hypothetical protein
MEQRLLFARIGWMRWYKGPRPDDERPIGGGEYTKSNLGNEAYNFLPIGRRVLGYFQPQMQPHERLKAHPSSIHLEKVEPGFKGNTLDKVMVVFVAQNPILGGQYIVGWYRNATVHRFVQDSLAKERSQIGYFVETINDNAKLVPVDRRLFRISSGKGGFGQANICYLFEDGHGTRKQVEWIQEAIEYISSYQHEDAAQHPTSETDHEISELIGTTIERSAGFQSNPRIRSAIEDYAMQWAFKQLNKLGLLPVDKHKTKPYDFLCTASGAELYVEVKGTQENGRCISLTPNEVKHAREHKNSALFIVYGVEVKGKKAPKVLGGKELFLRHWDISSGKLEARSYAFTLPESIFKS